MLADETLLLECTSILYLLEILFMVLNIKFNIQKKYYHVLTEGDKNDKIRCF